MISPEETAAKLDGSEYGEEGSRELFQAMRESGLVAVFGASDDRMEFRGAIDDEIDAWQGAIAYLNQTGLLRNECSDDECPYFERLRAKASTIRALWCQGDSEWSYQTTIPHLTFKVHEGHSLYCRGIVFALKDVP